MLRGEVLEDRLIDGDLDEPRQDRAEHRLRIRLEEVLDRRARVDVFFLRHERQDPPHGGRLTKGVHEAREDEIDLVGAAGEVFLGRDVADDVRVGALRTIAEAGELGDGALSEPPQLRDALTTDRDPGGGGQCLRVADRRAHGVRVHRADEAAVARNEHDERAPHLARPQERARLRIRVRREVVQHFAQLLLERSGREHGLLRAPHLRRRDRLLRLRDLLDVPDAPDPQAYLALGRH